MIIDGATSWGPSGERPFAPGFEGEARSKSIYEWVRQVRGGVLAGVFTIESHLTDAILHFMLGDRVRRADVLSTFGDAILAGLTFDKRINIVKMLTPHFRSAVESKALQSDLNELRTVRNAMAHHRFWFVPKVDDKGNVFDLVPCTRIGKGRQILTTPYIEKLNTKILMLIDQSAKLAVDVRRREVSLDD